MIMIVKHRHHHHASRRLVAAAVTMAVAITMLQGDVRAFQVVRPGAATSLSLSSTALHMGAFNKKKQQADFLRKVRDDMLVEKRDDELTPAQIKERNDRQRFDDLLNDEAATYDQMSELGGAQTYRTTQQEEEEMDASFSRVVRLYEGDPAPTAAFEGLVTVASDRCLGAAGTERLLPWLKKQNAKDFVVVISDPREKSVELRKLMATLPHRLGKNKNKLLFVTSDPAVETRKWIKKNDVDDIKIFSDEKREWMREFTALGAKRWSMCMFILADGKVQKMIRELDVDLGERAVTNAIKSLDV